MTIDGGRISSVEILRGAPCEASWIAAERVVGHPVADAARRYGLDVQLSCVADSSGWDPMYASSPVHFAAHVHQAAFEKALRRAGATSPPGQGREATSR